MPTFSRKEQSRGPLTEAGLTEARPTNSPDLCATLSFRTYPSFPREHNVHPRPEGVYTFLGLTVAHPAPDGTWPGGTWRGFGVTFRENATRELKQDMHLVNQSEGDLITLPKGLIEDIDPRFVGTHHPTSSPFVDE